MTLDATTIEGVASGDADDHAAIVEARARKTTARFVSLLWNRVTRFVRTVSDDLKSTRWRASPSA